MARATAPTIAPVVPPVAPAARGGVAPAVAPVIPPVAPANHPPAPSAQAPWPSVPGVAPMAPSVAPAVAAAPAAAAASGQLTIEQLAELDRLAATMDQLDYFEILGLEKAASPAEIKKAFYRGSRTFHPDKFFHVGEEELKKKVQAVYMRITEAYAILRDDAKRAKYIGDVTGPDRAQKLRFTEASEAEVKLQKKKELDEQIGTTPKGRQFYQTAVADLEAGRLAAAERNLKMALTFEPGNQRYKEKLKEAQDKLLEESRKSGSQFKIK
ncbi:MAG: DnaJ domain-containing protein [Myxococcaceae bacterium]|nr:DnaJ domain-containing protein [Myxococcaceae bacterium]